MNSKIYFESLISLHHVQGDILLWSLPLFIKYEYLLHLSTYIDNGQLLDNLLNNTEDIDNGIPTGRK